MAQKHIATALIEPVVFDGNGEPPEVDALPFVEKTGDTFNYWRPKRTGSPCEDWLIGTLYGVEAVNYINWMQSNTLLQGVSACMSERDVVEDAFWSYVSDQLIQRGDAA